MDFRSPGLVLPAIAYTPDLGNIGRRTWVEDGSVVVRFDIGDLRQHAIDTSDDVYMFMTRRPDDGVFHGTWTATVRDIDGVLTGTIDVPVDNEPVDVLKLLTTQRPWGLTTSRTPSRSALARRPTSAPAGRSVTAGPADDGRVRSGVVGRPCLR